MKKFFGLSLIIFCFTLFWAGCLNPVDDVTDETPSAPIELKPAPFAFAFEPAPLVYGYTNQAGEPAGTFIASGGSGTYTYELVDDGGADAALFRIEDDTLLIGEAELDWGRYAVQVRASDGSAACEQSCLMEVVITPAPITEAPRLVPHILDYAANTNKIAVRWQSAAGAEGYELYINTTDDPQTAALFSDTLPTSSLSADIASYPGTSADITRSTDYYVWVKAHNDAGPNDFSPSAKVRTSETVPEWWYNQDSEDVVRWNSDTDDYNITTTTVAYNMRVYPQSYAYQGTIRRHIKFDNAEVAALEPRMLRGKWGEDLSNSECGVFIIEYDHDPSGDDYRPGYVKSQNTLGVNLGNFIGIYYWGAGATMTPGAGNETHPLVAPHVGMKLMYSSNPVTLNLTTGQVAGYCETETYEQALTRFTLKDMYKYIAFIATPWYPVFDGMTTVGSCPHHPAGD